MLKLSCAIVLVLACGVSSWGAAPETCVSSAFRGAGYTGSEMACTYVCRSGQKFLVTRWSIDRLGGGVFTISDPDGNRLFRGHTHADYRKYQDPAGEFDPNLTTEGLAVRFCKE